MVKTSGQSSPFVPSLGVFALESFKYSEGAGANFSFFRTGVKSKLSICNTKVPKTV